MDYILSEGIGKKEKYRVKVLYSKYLGPKLLARVTRYLGVDILYQFGFTTAVIERMCTKGLLGGEIDLLTTIWASRDLIKSRFIKPREFDLLKKILPVFKRYFYLKPLFMLAAYRKSLNRASFNLTTYERLVFGKDRILADRTVLYDPLIFYIVELHKRYEKVSKDNMLCLMTIDLAKDLAEQKERLKDSPDAKKLEPERILYEAFSGYRLDQDPGAYCTIQKREGAYNIIPELYKIVRSTYSDQMIKNIQDYCMKMTETLWTEYRGHKFMNFTGHYRYKRPCLILEKIRGFPTQRIK